MSVYQLGSQSVTTVVTGSPAVIHKSDDVVVQMGDPVGKLYRQERSPVSYSMYILLLIHMPIVF